MEQSFISIKRFAGTPQSEILAFPKAAPRQIRSRISELEKLDIRSISLCGPTRIGKMSILGKGYAGVVVLAKMANKQVALKIRRTDSQRSGMGQEARLLRLANSVGVGPKLFSSSRNFLVMEYLDGVRIGQWLKQLQGAGRTKKLKTTIREILNECYRLDMAGLDHGELSQISKHVMINGSKPALIDFESASTKRRVSNVTSITQAIFIGSSIARGVQRVYKTAPKETMIQALQNYKHQMTQVSFDDLLYTLKL